MNDKILPLEDAIETLLATRDFCGDERQALLDWQADHGKLNGPQKEVVLRCVETRWLASQRAAGAIILTPEERKAAYRDIESGK